MLFWSGDRCGSLNRSHVPRSRNSQSRRDVQMRVQACTQPHMDTVHMLAQTVIVVDESVWVCLLKCLTAANKACPVSSHPLRVLCESHKPCWSLRDSSVRLLHMTYPTLTWGRTHRVLSGEQDLIWIWYVPRIRYASMSIQLCFALEL